MRFAPIAPISVAGLFNTHIHLVLEKFLREPAYVEYYKKRKFYGDMILLDNNAYEQSYSVADRALHCAIELMNPDYFFLPDVIGDTRETLRRSKRFWEDLDTGIRKNAIGVVQGNVNKEVMYCYDTFADYLDCIAIPRHLGYRRVAIAAELHDQKRWSERCMHWALGMNAGSISELSLLHELGFMGCDSSAPVWRGLNGYYLNEKWPDPPFDPFRTDFGKAAIEKAKFNLSEVLQACKLPSGKR